jgi:hypothetical protein
MEEKASGKKCGKGRQALLVRVSKMSMISGGGGRNRRTREGVNAGSLATF